MLDLDVPLAPEAARLDIDLPGRLGDENTMVGYRVEARSPAASKAVETLPIPPTASVLVVIRDGIAHSAASAPPLAPGDYVLALARPQYLALLDRLFGRRPDRSRADARGLSVSSPSRELLRSPQSRISMIRQRRPMGHRHSPSF